MKRLRRESPRLTVPSAITYTSGNTWTGMPSSSICNWAAWTTGWRSSDIQGMLHKGSKSDRNRMPSNIIRLKRKKLSRRNISM